jgi:hypothetical protein
MKPYQDMSTIASFHSPYRLRDMGLMGAEVSGESDDVGSELQEFRIRMANSKGTREAASLLLKKMYSWRGYSLEPQETHDPNKLILMADTGGKIVGTMTLCFDSQAGLPANDNFREELDMLRSQNRRLCEPSRLAIDKDTPKRVFAALMHISYIQSHNILGYTDYVIEVNPRHAEFYKRMLGFRELAGERMCKRVNAPAVLLRLECNYMKDQISQYGGSFENHGRERSFYPYFFSTQDEPGITHRLTSDSH